jgi:hypothetical protein
MLIPMGMGLASGFHGLIVATLNEGNVRQFLRPW